MRLEVFSQLEDAMRQCRYLHLRGTNVSGMRSVGLDEFLLRLSFEWHARFRSPSYYPISAWPFSSIAGLAAFRVFSSFFIKTPAFRHNPWPAHLGSARGELQPEPVNPLRIDVILKALTVYDLALLGR